jgi:hypothetical protein
VSCEKFKKRPRVRNSNLISTQINSKAPYNKKPLNFPFISFPSIFQRKTIKSPTFYRKEVENK